MSDAAGHVMEIFSAVQGEGPAVGVRQIFFRLFRCNLRCAWCDTPESFALSGKGRVESPPGSRSFQEFENPTSSDTALALLSPFTSRPHHSISFTGGEPLLQHRFLKSIIPPLKRSGEKIFLETGGSLPEILDDLIADLDLISMDIKLPSSTGERPLWESHEAFLRIAARKECYVKIVVTSDTVDEEIRRGLLLVRSVSAAIPVVLQPVSPFGGASPPAETRMLEWQDLALDILPDVRVIPQVHKLMGQR